MTSSYGSVSASEMVAAGFHRNNHMLQKAAFNRESLANVELTGRAKDKFENGFLGGVGSTSQFQGANQTLPVMPAQSNDDLEQRIFASRGITPDTRLLPSWQRSYAFAPGLGIDAFRSKITFTDGESGGRDPLTNVVAPVVNAGVDRVDSGPAPPIQTYQLGSANTQAPAVLTGGEGATIAEKITASGKTVKKQRLARG